MKLLIIGDAQHGKDTVAALMKKELGLKFTSSSEFCCKEFLFDILKDKYGYKTIEECFEDRVNHRAEWKQLISAYNTPDKTKLARKIFEENDMYVGLRDLSEFNACSEAELFDLIIWVQNDRVSEEPKDSMELNRGLANIVLHNNGTKKDLEKTVKTLCEYVKMHGLVL